VSREALLARLARLDAQDRAWLLGELPPEMRRTLIDGLDEDAALPITLPPAPAPQGWESIDPQQGALVLEAEPAWLISAATRACEAKWREKLLQHLPARHRHEVEVADRAGRTLNLRAAGLVLAACRDRIAEGAATVGTSAPRGGFAALVEQMRSRFS
jgi:Mg/Co/Ni transporter MgtE